MESTVAVVILNWNGKKFLEDFLPGVIEHSKNDAEVYVADNASTDGSVQLLREQFPQVNVLLNETNGGYAQGYNDALSQIHADYYVLLNSDIEVTPGWIRPVVRLMESQPNVAACQPKMLAWHDRNRFEYAGAGGGYIDKYGYPFCRGRLFQSLELDHGQYDDEANVFWATGACLFVRSDVFWILGGLDNRFFAHMEEIDFCWRAKNNGYTIKYCPDSVVYHVGGGTLPKISWRKTYLNMRNNAIMLYKNLPDERIIPVFSIRLILDGIAAIKFLFDGGFRDFFAVIRAHLSFYRVYPELKRERKLQAHKKVADIYQKNLVVEYFIRRKKKFTDLDPLKFS
jgi:GT2 family glycosyltransferase